MKLKFNGVIEERKSGCKCAGRTSGSKLTTMKSYILPSGITKTFRIGHPEEVSAEDAEFLLSYNNEVRTVFEVV